MKKIILASLIVLSTLTFGEMTKEEKKEYKKVQAEMTKEQKKQLDKLTTIFYPDADMMTDRIQFKKIETKAFEEIIRLRDENVYGIPAEIFNELWAEQEKQFPGDFIQQKKELAKVFTGYKASNVVREAKEKQAAEEKKVKDEAAKKEIQKIETEDQSIPKEIMDQIIGDAKVMYPNDHIAQKKEIENRMKAYEDMMKYFDLKSPKK